MELNEIKKKVDTLQNERENLKQMLSIDKKKVDLEKMDAEMADSTFWDDMDHAKKISSVHAATTKDLSVWQSFTDGVEEAEILMEFLEEDNDDSTRKELEILIEKLEMQLNSLSLALLFSDPLDELNCYVELHSGEGGVDSQDFAQMLMRMYLRWAESEGASVEVLSMQSGDEAGIKSATLFIQGDHTFGKLKGETGVHRLVRLSPFDTAKRRHTSFASVNVIPEIDDTIEIEIPDNELKVDTYRSSGAGGQSVNTTDSAVRITHLPSGIVVTCQNERSQIQNREQAMKILRSKLYEKALEEQEASKQSASGDKKGIGFGSQIRSYVMHPYQMVKDHRTNVEVGNISDVLDGRLDVFIESYLSYLLEENKKNEVE